MQSRDIWRGLFASYGTAVAGLVTVSAANGSTFMEIAQYALGGVLMFGGYGLLALIPAALAAFVCFGLLRPRVTRFLWWHPVAIIAALATIIFVPLAPVWGSLFWIVALGIGLGAPFWLGAAGARWSVPAS